MTLKEAARELRAIVGQPVYVSIDVIANFHVGTDGPSIAWRAYVDGSGIVVSDAPTLEELLRRCRVVLAEPTPGNPDVDAAAIQAEAATLADQQPETQSGPTPGVVDLCF